MKSGLVSLGELAASVTPQQGVSQPGVFKTGAIQTQCRGDAQVNISGLTEDSRQVSPGDLFFCVTGTQQDGHNFAAEALAKGAVALVVERWLPLECPQVLTASVRHTMGPMSATYYGNPSQKMQIAGVTGTNGKTTVCSLLGDILSAGGMAAETVGTLSGTLTTPAPTQLHRQLACWHASGVQAVAMEVSSHALQQHRTDGICYDLAVFTNLSRDHLDYHKSLENYFAAKARLFTPELAKQALVNLADPYGQRLASAPAIPTVGFNPSAAMTRARKGGLSLHWRGHEVNLNLQGSFNVANALAAAEAAALLGMDTQQVVAGLEGAAPIPGRFERVPTRLPFVVLVDYAHTPDALAQVLNSAKEWVEGAGKLRVVFGCGGERDLPKRPQMGRVASELCDHVTVTSDNPRGEAPESILVDIVAGADGDAICAQNVDRRSAIRNCLGDATTGDVVVIAGKGHETTQTIGTQVVPFDDRVVAKEALAALEAQANLSADQALGIDRTRA